MLAAACAAHGTSVVVDHRGRRRGGAKLLEDVERLAQGLVDLGVRPGQRVAIVCAAHLEAVIALHAVLRIGAVAVPHDPESTTRELRRLFEDHSPVLVIADRVTVPALRELPRDVQPRAVVGIDPPRTAREAVRSAVRDAMRDRLQTVVRTRGAVAQPARTIGRRRRIRPHPFDRTIAWSGLLASCPLDDGHPAPEPQDLAILLYGSGPDGELLGATLTHENMVSRARTLAAAWETDGAEDGAVVAAMPLHEPGGLVITALAPVLAGRPIALADSAETLIPAVRRVKPSVLCAPAAVLLRAALISPAAAVDIGRAPRALTFFDGAEAPVVRRIARLIGRAPAIVDARLECGIAVVGSLDEERQRPVCRPLPEVRTDITDGELRVAGPQVFHGYWNRPDETAHVLAGDGWARTGVHVSADGEALELLGSLTPRIVAPDGRSISPREVAGALLGHPDVARAEVSGEHLPDGGQTVRAVVELREGSSCTAEELRSFVAARLAPVKVPRTIDLVQAA